MAKPRSKIHSVKLALVGSETLLGKELEEVLGRRTPEAAIAGFAASGEGNFGESEDQPVYLEPLQAASLREVQAVLIAGSAEGAQKAYALAKAEGGRPALIDCTGHLENRPEARIVAPLVCEVEVNRSWLLEIGHPVASALALTLKRLAKYRNLRRVIAHVFEPASERGKRGISELHQQTTSLLAFKPLDKEVFDAQLSFNLLSQYGEEAPLQLAAIEQRIERHITAILSSERTIGTIPMPSLRVIAAPVFHGYSISLWAEFEADINAQDLREALASAQIDVRGAKEEAPEVVGAASQSGVMAGDIRIDRNNPHAAWLWIVGDNLRLTADAAADLVKNLEKQEQ